MQFRSHLFLTNFTSGKIPNPTWKISGSDRIGLSLKPDRVWYYKPDQVVIGSGFPQKKYTNQTETKHIPHAQTKSRSQIHNHKDTNKETTENRLITHTHYHTTRNREPSSANSQEPREKLTRWCPTAKSQEPRANSHDLLLQSRDLLPPAAICCRWDRSAALRPEPPTRFLAFSLCDPNPIEALNFEAESQEPTRLKLWIWTVSCFKSDPFKSKPDLTRKKPELLSRPELIWI